MSGAAKKSDDDRVPHARPQSVAQVLAFATRRAGWNERLAAERAKAAFVEAAGPHFSRHCVPLRVEGGVLYLAVAAPAWAQELSQHGAEIVARLRRLAPRVVHSLRPVLVAELPPAAPAGAPPAKSAAQPIATAQVVGLDAALAAIPSDELRARAAAAIAVGAAWSRRNAGHG